MTVSRLSSNIILPAILTVMVSYGAIAQEDTAAAADKAAKAAEEAQQTAEQAQKAAEATTQQADEAKQRAEANTQKADEAKQQSAENAEKLEQAKLAAEAEADKQAAAATDIQKQLDAQAALIAAQAASGTSANSTLADLQRTLNEQKKLIAAQKKQIEEQQAQLQTTSDLLTNMQSQIDQLKDDEQNKLSEDDVAMRERLAALETQVGKIPDDPSAMLVDESFPGAIRVPGTSAAYKISGFVKAALVKNFDPLVTQDRFIVGSIPVTTNDQTALASETSLTANQTRVNFDYRQRRDSGQLRAFVEGDFFGDGNTFRLRHAFGQYKDLLAGKTWSAFYDAEASPEEVDFEGINGHVVVRQTQIRYFPKIGKDFRWMISMEDPNPQVTGGEGVSDLPDLVSSIRRDWFGGWHVKTAVLLRQIRAVPNSGVDQNGQACDPASGTVPGQTPDSNGCFAIADVGDTQSDYGWAVTASGKVQVPWFDEKDNFLFQLNYGEGLGRYLTDLSSIAALEIDGGQDGVINRETGELKTLPIFGGYLAFQHWWNKTVRSTFIVSLVNVNNLGPEYQLPTSYSQTQRAGGNVIWSPVRSLDLGAEFLWGKRKNNGGTDTNGAPLPRSGTATQLQLEAKYRF